MYDYRNLPPVADSRFLWALGGPLLGSFVGGLIGGGIGGGIGSYLAARPRPFYPYPYGYGVPYGYGAPYW